MRTQHTLSSFVSLQPLSTPLIRRIIHIAQRECHIVWRSSIYRFCILVFPLLVVVFFTTLMAEGVPQEMPVGVVDLDRTATTREMVRKIDAMQTSQVVNYFASMDEARQAVQRGEIYAFVLLPQGTTQQLISGRQPRVSFYYSSVTLLAGSMTYRDLRTVLTLAAARVGMAKLAALGLTEQQIKAQLQPIDIDLHMVGNPQANYNVYLSTYVTPGVLMLFVFLLVPYAIWTEVKMGRSREWMKMAGGNIHVALLGKLLPHTLMFLAVFLAFEFYVYGFLNFPHPGGLWPILISGVLSVLACQAFGVFVASLIPSLRMSMSICSLWAVISFSMCGATFPVTAMDTPLRALATLFPLRHYIVIYQVSIFDGFPLTYVLPHICALLLFVCLPAFTSSRLRHQMLHPIYLP